MKAYRFSMIAALFMAALLAVMTGCKFDVAEPLWYKDFATPPQPVITGIDPAQAAVPGVNYVTIYGENFDGVPDVNGVYFGTTPAEIAEKSATTIKVRRPNLVTDSCIVKVVSDSALLVAKLATPYRIDAVLEPYGSFLDNTALSVVAVDAAENLFVVETGSRSVYKVTPTGDKTVIGTATRAPLDMSIGPDGNLYLTGNNRAIDQVNLATGTVGQWTRLPAGKVVKFCDFDNAGYFYSGGVRTDLVVMPFDQSTAATSAGFYASEEILAIRFYNGNLYVVSRVTTNPAKIWKHQIGANGSVGPQQLVFDMSTASDFSSRLIKAFGLSANGTIFLGTDAPNPILIVDPATNSVDEFYKNILPSYCKHFNWGSKTFLYMISGNTDPAQEWTVHRVDMGTPRGAR